jgi:hypothetical protein
MIFSFSARSALVLDVADLRTSLCEEDRLLVAELAGASASCESVILPSWIDITPLCRLSVMSEASLLGMGMAVGESAAESRFSCEVVTVFGSVERAPASSVKVTSRRGDNCPSPSDAAIEARFDGCGEANEKVSSIGERGKVTADRDI